MNQFLRFFVVLSFGLISIFFLSACSSVATVVPKPLPPLSIGPDAVVPSAQLSALNLVENMRVGWNLGNTLDSWSGASYTDGWIEKYSGKTPEDYEKAWGNPVTTAAVFKAVRAAGFGVVRIPVTWGPHLDADNNIQQIWLDKVQSVVDMALAAGLYCIINVHHDTGADTATWLKASTKNQVAMEARFGKLWQGIARHFASYDHRLIFEGFNEILDEGNNWGGSSAESLGEVNRLNQLFVNTVRSTGSANVNRFLVVNTYAASTVQAVLDAFVVPVDSATDRLIVEVHDYGPTEFTWQQEIVSWATTRSTWGTEADYQVLRDRFGRLKTRFVNNGIPVILGEFCADNKQNLADRMRFATASIQIARQNKMTCFWWDAGGDFKPDSKQNRSYYSGGSLLNRHTMSWAFPELNDALVRAWSTP